jgi:plasmid replication initiation protein
MLNSEIGNRKVIASDNGEGINGDKFVITPQIIKEIKRKKKIPLLVGYANLDELVRLFPEYFSSTQVKYLKKLLRKLEGKSVLEVKLEDYIGTLERFGYDYVIKSLKIPEPRKVEYYGISLMTSMALMKDNTLMVIFSPYVSPLLLELKSHYTTYDFLQVMTLPSLKRGVSQGRKNPP